MSRIVVFDLLCSQPVGDVKFHGGGEYTKVVFKTYVTKYLKAQEVYVCYDESKFLDDSILELIKEKGLKTVNVSNYKQIVDFLYKLEKKTTFEVRFFAGLGYGYKKVVFPKNIIAIGTFHGLRSIEKQYDKYTLKYYRGKALIKEWLKIVLKRYMHKRYYNMFFDAMTSFNIIVTDSVHSAYSLKLNFPQLIENKELNIFYPLTQLPDVSQSDEVVDGKYILIISANRWIKNSYRAIRVLDKLFNKGLLQDYNVKVFGNCPHRIRKSVKNTNKFNFYNYVSNEELEEAFKNCSVMFYPTLNEGFGNVPMEAIKYNKTCVVSAVCSLPEIYRDIVYYCNPYDDMEMQNRILQAVDNKMDKNKLSDWLNKIQKKQKSDMQALCNLINGVEESA